MIVFTIFCFIALLSFVVGGPVTSRAMFASTGPFHYVGEDDGAHTSHVPVSKLIFHLRKYDVSNGTLLWSKQFGSSADHGRLLAIHVQRSISVATATTTAIYAIGTCADRGCFFEYNEEGDLVSQFHFGIPQATVRLIEMESEDVEFNEEPSVLVHGTTAKSTLFTLKLRKQAEDPSSWSIESVVEGEKRRSDGMNSDEETVILHVAAAGSKNNKRRLLTTEGREHNRQTNLNFIIGVAICAFVFVVIVGMLVAVVLCYRRRKCAKVALTSSEEDREDDKQRPAAVDDIEGGRREGGINRNLCLPPSSPSPPPPSSGVRQTGSGDEQDVSSTAVREGPQQTTLLPDLEMQTKTILFGSPPHTSSLPRSSLFFSPLLFCTYSSPFSFSPSSPSLPIAAPINTYVQPSPSTPPILYAENVEFTL